MDDWVNLIRVNVWANETNGFRLYIAHRTTPFIFKWFNFVWLLNFIFPIILYIDIDSLLTGITMNFINPHQVHLLFRPHYIFFVAFRTFSASSCFVVVSTEAFRSGSFRLWHFYFPNTYDMYQEEIIVWTTVIRCKIPANTQMINDRLMCVRNGRMYNNFCKEIEWPLDRQRKP